MNFLFFSRQRHGFGGIDLWALESNTLVTFVCVSFLATVMNNFEKFSYS